METKKISEFCKERGFVQAGKSIRANVNGYLFITFITAENEAENVYFSKAGSEKYEDGTPVTMDLLKSLQVAEVENASGEKRIKLITNSERLDLDFGEAA